MLYILFCFGKKFSESKNYILQFRKSQADCRTAIWFFSLASSLLILNPNPNSFNRFLAWKL